MNAVILALLGGGVVFSVLAAIGVVRMPDVYTRMQASSKAGTLGCVLILAAVALAFDDAATTARVVLAAAFVLLTGPVAAHVVSRAAYRSGTPPAKETAIDDLARDEGRTDGGAEGDPSGD